MNHPLPLTEPALDPAGERRADPQWLAQQWQHPDARVVMVSADSVQVVDSADAAPQVQWLSPTQLPTDQSGHYDGDWVFLGLAPDGTPYFAVAAEGERNEHWCSVRELGIADPNSPDVRIVIGALAVLNWHRRHPRCPICGTATHLTQGGWIRRCPADDSQHFPRVDPAVIMLVVDSDDRALLGRQTRWPPGWFSTLAGFVEPGETLENAVAREVLEEVGVTVGEVRYRASQPWPFPSSLMLGFHATARTTELRPDLGEIAEAQWFTREQLQHACTAGTVRLPPLFSISRWLIELWFGTALPGDWSRE